jgi:anti-sigma factor RsiW
MMNQDQELKIQAFLDGELSEREARDVQQWLASDAQAQALVTELRTTTSYLKGNEPALALPETREFYWNKIQREIERQEAAPATAARLPFWIAWRRYFAPMAGVAAVTMLVVFSMKINDIGLTDGPNGHLAEIENLSEHSSSLSFRSQKENMFVVWVYNKDQKNDETDMDSMDDTIVQ